MAEVAVPLGPTIHPSRGPAPALWAVGLPHASVAALLAVRSLFIVSGVGLVLSLGFADGGPGMWLLTVAAAAAIGNTLLLIAASCGQPRTALWVGGLLDFAVMVFVLLWIAGQGEEFGPMAPEIMEVALIIGTTSALIHLGVVVGSLAGLGLLTTYATCYFLIQGTPDGPVSGVLHLAMGGVVLVLLVPLIAGIRFEHFQAEAEKLVAERRSHELGALNRLVQEGLEEVTTTPARSPSRAARGG